MEELKDVSHLYIVNHFHVSSLYNPYRVLARPYLILLYVIFPIHVSFPITFTIFTILVR